MKSMRLMFVLWILTVSAGLAFTAPRPLGATVLVVPARYTVLQVAFDVSDRMGAALVAYQGDAGSQTPVIDYWMGQEWKRLTLTEYERAAFVGGRVSRFFIVGTEEILPPILVSSVSRWCGDVRVITSLDTPGLVNALGKAFNFSPSEWEWFARRYNLQLADRNAERRQQSWYDRDYYDDDWAQRWPWLRRKYNPPSETWSNDMAPSTLTPASGMNTRNPRREPVPAYETTAPPVVKVAPEGKIERLDVPIGETSEASEPMGDMPSAEAVVPQASVEENELSEPEEETSPVK